MTMLRGFSLRLFPTKSQEQKLWQSAGVARWVWNWGRKLNQERYVKGERQLDANGLRKEFTRVRDSGEFPWLKEASRKVADHALMDLGQAYKSFYRDLKTGRNSGLPKYKDRERSAPSFCIDADRVYDDGKGCLFLLKVGHVRFKAGIPLTGARFRNTRIKFKGGEWIMTFVLEAEPDKPKLRDCAMGIDVGVRSLAVASCGGKKRAFKNINRSHRVRRLERQLRHRQRSLSRKQRGSRNRKKAQLRLKQTYGRLKHIRKDYAHKVTTALVRMLPKTIVLEDLNLKRMMKNANFAKKLAEQGFYRFRQYIEYKAAERGIEVRFADKFFASSKICSRCGGVKKDLRWSDRVFHCPHCGMELDRDLNAARNLEKLAA